MYGPGDAPAILNSQHEPLRCDTNYTERGEKSILMLLRVCLTWKKDAAQLAAWTVENPLKLDCIIQWTHLNKKHI